MVQDSRKRRAYRLGWLRDCVLDAFQRLSAMSSNNVAIAGPF